jgi:hypothetical protein
VRVRRSQRDDDGPDRALTRFLNQRLSADFGWCRNQSQAASIIVVRNRAFPDFEIPCSLFKSPLRQGLGAKPA